MFGNPERSRTIAYSAAFIGLITLGSWISIPFFPVPFTLQTLFVLLAGVVMKRYAVVPVSLYIFLGAIGLPVFHNGIAGIGILLGPTGGYIIGFIFAAFIAGFAYEQDSVPIRVTGFAVATLAIYLFGVGWIMISLGRGFVPSLMAGAVPFIVGDTVKAFCAFVIGQKLT